MEDATESFEGTSDAAVGRRTSKKRVRSATDLEASLVQVEVRQIEREALVFTIGAIVENPLSHRTNDSEAGQPVGKDVPLVAAALPFAQVAAGPADVGAQRSAESTSASAQLGCDLEPAQERAELVVCGAKQIAADVAQEMEMAGEHGDIEFELGDEGVAGLRHGAAEIAHDGAGGPEAADDVAEAGKNDIGAFGRDLPCAQHPATPAGEDDEERAATVLAGGIDVKRPPTVPIEGGAQLTRAGLVKRREVCKKPATEKADLACRKHDAVLAERGADLLALAMRDEAGEADEDEEVVTDGALGWQPLGKGAAPAYHERPVVPSTAGRADMHGLPGDEASVLQSDAMP